MSEQWSWEQYKFSHWINTQRDTFSEPAFRAGYRAGQASKFELTPEMLKRAQSAYNTAFVLRAGDPLEEAIKAALGIDESEDEWVGSE